jgi:hypothetical protein
MNFNFFEKPVDILCNYAGFYGVPRAEAIVRARQELESPGSGPKAEVMLAHTVRRHEAPADDRAGDDDAAEAADPRRAHRRRRHRDPPRHVEDAARGQRRRHHRDPDHALPGGSGEPVPQPGDHRPRPIIEQGR